MNVALRIPRMTRDQFFPWAEAQDARYEFDGFAPVRKTGGTVRHNQIALAVHRLLYALLKGASCHVLGQDAGVATVGNTVRYPDALVSCSALTGDALLVPDVVAVFEVLSPSSQSIDRITKLREYGAVPSILHYVIMEQNSAALTSFARTGAGLAWTATALMAEDTLSLPEIGIEVPVVEFYDGVDLPADPDGD